jgi:hypothetical protein
MFAPIFKSCLRLLLPGCIFLAGISYAYCQSDSKLQIPPREFIITVHYDLGMHCTGFDLSYCCILPPYNSILSQIIRTSDQADELPVILTEADLEARNQILWYEHDRNTYSEGPKLLYWNVPVDVNEDGDYHDPNDSFANAYWKHLYTYEEQPLRYMPYPLGKLTKLYIGIDLPVPQDHGPTGKPLSHGKLDYTGPHGTILYTVTNDGISETPLVLAMRGYWEALGLPLTAFYDGAIGNIREATEPIIRPYQKAKVSLAEWHDRNEDDIPQTTEVKIAADPRSAEAVTFWGTNPIDVPGCDKCHASERANGEDYTLWEKEYTFWKNRFPNTSDYYARIKAASISLLEIHDAKHDTEFLKDYEPGNRTGASVTRLGRPPVRCQECHADNIVGQLQGHTEPGKEQAVSSLTEAVHLLHLGQVPDPDDNGRTASCQGCHPAHQQSGDLSFFPLDSTGHFRGGDIRDYRGGCFLGRDLHSNPQTGEILGTATHLNAVGNWMKENVLNDGNGMYCTNCHNLASRLLYKADTLTSVLSLAGRTLRNSSVPEMLAAFRKMANGRYKNLTAEDFFDPKVNDKAAIDAVWLDEPSDPYRIVDDGGDYWLAAGEPKCADCHLPPFVENMGGIYFPIDQVEKLALMRYSKGHHGISCQSCHQSTHGLYPVRADGADPTSLSQAQYLNPDGHAGPLRCNTCHVVDAEGIPTVVSEEMLAPFPKSVYPTRYEQAVALMHTARTYEEIHGPGK